MPTEAIPLVLENQGFTTSSGDHKHVWETNNTGGGFTGYSGDDVTERHVHKILNWQVADSHGHTHRLDRT